MIQQDDILHWDQPHEPKGNEHVTMTVAEALEAYTNHFKELSQKLNRPMLNEHGIIQEILIINWGYLTDKDGNKKNIF